MATQRRRHPLQEADAADRHRLARFLLGIGVLHGMLLPSAMAQSAWELSPYRVSIVLAFDDTPELSREVQDDTMRAVAQQASAVFGAMWHTKVEAAPDTWRPTMLSHIDALSAEMIPTKDLLPDKILAVAVRVVPGGLRVDAREFDGRTFAWRKSAHRVTRQSELLAEMAFQAILEAFGPLARIEFLDKDRVSLHPRASGLPPGDPAFAQLSVGDILRPFIRRRDRRDQPGQGAIRTIDWTYLVVEQVDQKGVACRVVSGLRHPFGLRQRGRIEYLALPIRTDAAPIRLRLRSRNDPDLSLAGYEVLARNEQTATFEPLGRTNWNGEITIPPNGRSTANSQTTSPPASANQEMSRQADMTGSAVRLLEIRSSGETFARFPVVTGFHAQVTAKIADDAVRIRVQGFLMEIEDELVDLVARRQILMARVSRGLEGGELDEAGRYLDQLKQLRDRQELLSEIRRVERTSKSKDPLVQTKIERLFEKTRKLLAKYLDPRPVNRLQSEYDQAARKRRSAGGAR